jgi:hypothetical protein
LAGEKKEEEKENSIAPINRRPGHSAEMQLQLRKVTAFQFYFTGWNGLMVTVEWGPSVCAWEDMSGDCATSYG